MPKYSTENIISQFKAVHGDKFDYSLVVYVHSQQKVKIICRKHGEFEQLVGMHRKGQGCAKCMYDEKRSTQKVVIDRFNEVHSFRYDYSEVVYKNTDTKVKIICDTHGIFEQAPEKHLQGNGCPKCIGKNFARSEVISEFKASHGLKYDYTKVDFKLKTTKVEILCPSHGSFFQTPQAHISGKGCPKCSGTLKLTQEEYLEICKNIHGQKYDYSKVEYKSGKRKVEIICPLHGIFDQQAESHKRGAGCPHCVGNLTLNTFTAVKQFQDIHGSKYDYSLVDYKNAHAKIKIICKEHGRFEQSPHKHKSGRGCPNCAVTIGHTKSSYVEYCKEFDGLTNLYIIKCTSLEESFYKVGISRVGALGRFDSNLKMPYKFEVLAQICGDVEFIWDLEKAIHKILFKYKHLPIKDFHGKSECFSEIPKAVYKIIEKFDNSNQIQLVT